MNKRQKKKFFKKKYGVNPPNELPISVAGTAAELIKNNRSTWGKLVNCLIGLGKAMYKVYEKILEDEWQENIKKLVAGNISRNDTPEGGGGEKK